MKNNVYIFITTLFSVSVLTMCDANFEMVRVKQSIYNSTLDTITVINSLTEFRGVDIDTIICYPFLETVFFDKVLKDQPLEPYDAPFIGFGSLVNVSSGKCLKKTYMKFLNGREFLQKVVNG